MNSFGINNVLFYISSVHFNWAIDSVNLPVATLGKTGLSALQNFIHENDGRNGREIKQD